MRPHHAGIAIFAVFTLAAAMVFSQSFTAPSGSASGGSATNAVVSINGDTATAQTIALGSAGFTPAIATAAGTTTIGLPVAGDVTNGVLSSNHWQRFNGKTDTNFSQAVSNSVTVVSNYVGSVSNYVDTASSNRVRVVAGTGGITVSSAGSGGVQTFTVSDDDAGGGATAAVKTVQTNGVFIGAVGNTNHNYVPSTTIYWLVTNANGSISLQAAVVNGSITGDHIVSGVLLTNASFLNSTNRGTQVNIGLVTNKTHVAMEGKTRLFEDIVQFTQSTAAFFQTFLQSLQITNYVDRVVTNSTSTTPAIDWNGPGYIRLAPAGAFTASLTNTPALGSPSRSIRVDVITAQTGTFANVGATGIDWGADAGPVFVSGATNTFLFTYTGTNIVAVSGQELVSGTGATAKTNAPTLNNATLLNTTTATTVSNLANNLFAIFAPPITASNLVVDFKTNNIECVGLTNVILTNLVELATGINAKVKVVIRNVNGSSVALVLPAFGAQHGYYWHTNGLNDTLAAVAPPGSNTVFSLEADGTNIYPSVTYWRHP